MKVFRLPGRKPEWINPTKPRPWSPEEVEIVKQYYHQVPIRIIAEILREKFPPGRTYDAIRLQARKMRTLGLL